MRIAVIGGGLCGTAFAIHLLRDFPSLPVEIDIVEPRQRLGAGLAYGTTDPTHRVNVAASRLSLFAEEPDDCERWLDRDGRIAADTAATLPDGRRYPARSLYGAYVADTLRAVSNGSRAGICRHRRAHALDAMRRPEGGFTVRLSDGGTLETDLLLLATGHAAPAVPSALSDVPADRLVADPWRPGALDAIGPDDAVLVVGTGLTACDVMASLAARAYRGRVIAVSRRGLLPRPRTTRKVAAFGDFGSAPHRTARSLLAAVRAAVRAAARLDRPWEDVIDALRSDGATVWNALPIAERRRLLRHVRPFWDVHRFQSAPPVDEAVRRALDDGMLVVRAASIRSVRTDAARLVVELRPRVSSGDERLETVVVDHVVNCTGPGHRTIVETNPFLAALAREGLVGADALRLGLHTDRQSRAIDAGGEAAPDLFVLGPPARAAHGELMGLPQVSAQPRDVARRIATDYAGRLGKGDETSRDASI